MNDRKMAVALATLGSVLAACLAIAAPAFPQAAQTPQAPDYLDRVMTSGSYLEGFADLERGVTAAGPGGQAVQRAEFNTARTFLFGGTADYVPANTTCPDRETSAEIQAAQLADAIPEIVRRARSAWVVILNENHYAPRDRAFGLMVARALRPLGYRYLAMEALIPAPRAEQSARSMAELSHRGHVVHSTGFDTNEPMFADFIRQALSLGYEPYAYDLGPERNAADRIASREERQAQVIHQRMIAPHPQGKFLIYVGFGHVAEGPFDGHIGRQMDWMANRLKRIAGLDPVTIDQREQVDPGCLPGEIVRRGLGANRFGDVILRRNGASLVTGSYRGAVDLQVIHLPVAPVHRRPAWMTQIGRRPLPIPTRLLGNRTTRLVQAFARDSSPDAVPIDQLIVRPGETNPPPLMVPDRTVILRVQDEAAGHRP